jgi:hypothetical protein
MTGVAGGVKYLANGIFVKFALDFSSLYGGDEFSNKAASQELLGAQQMFRFVRAGKEALRVPLMTVVDICGYRLIASGLMPLASSSLVYGSDDGGVTVHKSDATLAAIMDRAAKFLNLKPHIVGQNTELSFPADIEVRATNFCVVAVLILSTRVIVELMEIFMSSIQPDCGALKPHVLYLLHCWSTMTKLENWSCLFVIMFQKSQRYWIKCVSPIAFR